MKIKLTYLVITAIFGLTGAAVANEMNNNNDRSSALDSYTFPDGTVVRTAVIGMGTSTQQPVLQIKTASGKECYGFGFGVGSSSISCL